MTQFIQLHALVSYPPSNLNRDDLGRPKTAIMGGANRLRISSQSLKRAWRTSELFESSISDESIEVFDKSLPKHIGQRSKTFSEKWFKSEMVRNNIDDDLADLWSKDISLAFGQVENDENKLSQLAHLSDVEIQGCYLFVKKLITYLKHNEKLTEGEKEVFIKLEKLQESRSKKKKSDDIKKVNQQIAKELHPEILNSGKTSVDIALFGRMLASSPAYNVEAAAQVAHAVTVHAVKVDDDYFTAVDDLNNHDEDAGAAHIGETGFASGVFYLYVCIDKTQLCKNLQNDTELTNKTLAALVEAMAKVSPTGKQNSFASRAYTSYLLAEIGSQQPRSLSVAFLKPVQGQDLLSDAIESLVAQCDSFDKVYGACAAQRKSFQATPEKTEGSLESIISFLTAGEPCSNT